MMADEEPTTAAEAGGEETEVEAEQSTPEVEAEESAPEAAVEEPAAEADAAAEDACGCGRGARGCR